MAQIIALKIDTNRIDKSKIFKGKKGNYLNLTLMINDDADQYGNQGSISHEQTKEERDSKAHKQYVGNAKIIWEGSYSNKNNANEDSASSDPIDNDDLPF